jgi:CO dehydrogenase/acetyl-CoA synthase gamma subunit (corrinoid Fe-S protein)
VDALLKDKEKLAAILTYHVVSGKVMASDVVKLRSAKTVNGKSVKIRVMGGKVMVDDAEVVTTDVETTNGVIHVIDTVILPGMQEGWSGRMSGSMGKGPACEISTRARTFPGPFAARALMVGPAPCPGFLAAARC